MFERLRVKPPAWALVLLAVAVTGVVLGALAPRPSLQRAARGPVASRPAGLAASAPAPTTATAAVVGRPRWLRIPTIGVDAQVDPVGVTPQGNMDVPGDVRHVGWYAAGVVPGQPGDAVLDGHLDWSTGPAVFWRLRELRPGDAVVMELTDGAELVFRVSGAAAWPSGPPPAGVFGRGGPPRLTLITCAGTWNGREYTKRLLVDAALS